MNAKKLLSFATPLFIMILSIIALPTLSFAHCDSMNGPVVKAAQKALETGDVKYVFVWIQKSDEKEIAEAFRKTISVRKLNSEAREFADRYFFETLVRVHRAGEGAPYTGLKSADWKPEAGIDAADNAVESGSAKALLTTLNDAVHDGLHGKFADVMKKKNYKAEDVVAGRDFVKSYVTFIHYAERILQATQAGDEHHTAESTESHQHEH